MVILSAKTKQDNFNLNFQYTVKLVYNNHHGDPKFVVVVVRWSWLKGGRCSEGRYLLGLQNGGRCSHVVVNSGLTVHFFSSNPKKTINKKNLRLQKKTF
jgi:hypothetical protein